MQFDSVQIGARDLDDGRQAYETLLGVTPIPRDAGGWRFPLERGAIDLVPADVDGIRSFTFAAPDAATLDVHGIRVVTVPAPDTRSAAAVRPDAAMAIDHAVVRSVDPERAIATWRDRHGIRLALDREFPSRHLRLLFFRSNGITLEYATPFPLPDDRSTPDGFFGVTYRVPDLAARRDALLAAGVSVSGIRPGMRADTIVATVHGRTLDVPTLLLQRVPAA